MKIPIVLKKYTQALRDRPDALTMRQLEQQIIAQVFTKEKRTLLAAGGCVLLLIQSRERGETFAEQALKNVGLTRPVSLPWLRDRDRGWNYRHIILTPKITPLLVLFGKLFPAVVKPVPYSRMFCFSENFCRVKTIRNKTL